MKKKLSIFQNYFQFSLALLFSVGFLPINLQSDLVDQQYSLNYITEDELEETIPDLSDPSEGNNQDEYEIYDFGSDLIISAINPGYNIDEEKNVGDFIELRNLTNAPLVLAGFTLRYTNSTGKTSNVFTFPEGSYMTGKHLLLRYHNSSTSDMADANYKVDIAMKAGPLALYYEDQLVDTVCWNGSKACEREFKNTVNNAPTTLVRDLQTGKFEHVLIDDFMPNFDPDSPALHLPDESEEDEMDEDLLPPPQCRGLEFSEILTYYTDDKTEQFIEVFNPTSVEINLNGCFVGYKNKAYPLVGRVGVGQYLAIYQSDLFTLTKNPTNPSILTLIDADGYILDEVAYPHGQKRLTTYAKIFDSQGNESWQITYAITPNAENVYQKFRSCEEGKVINETTGNCVKVTSLKTTINTLKNSIAAPCPAGKYRNPLTGRCKKIETTSQTLKECAEGYERNPETNRCRKVKSNTPNDGAEYAIEPTTSSDKKVFIGFGIVTIILVLGIVYVGLQFRNEIVRVTRKIRQRFNNIRKDLFACAIGRHRNKKP